MKPASTNSPGGIPSLLRKLVPLLLCLSTAILSLALEPSTPLANYSRQSWTTDNGLPQNTIQTLVQSFEGYILITTEAGAVRFNGYTFQPIPQPPAPTPHQPSPALNLPIGTRIQATLTDHHGTLWIGTNKGLRRLKTSTPEFFPLTDPLATASILSLLEDHEGNLWIGTETTGLQILRDQSFHTLTTRDGLSSDNITAVLEDSQQTLWTGTNGAGLTAIRKDRTTHYSVRSGLLSDIILSLASSPRGDLWIGTPDGLNLLRSGRMQSFTSADGLPDDLIRSLMADTDNSLWIGTRHGLSHWINPPLGPMHTYTQSSGLSSDLIGAIARDANGNLWIATLSGLSRLHNNAFQNFTTANGLPSNTVTALLPQPNGQLLIGTQDHGWTLWDGQKFSPTHLPNTSIHAILQDTANNLWFATSKGITRCTSPDTCLDFSTADGLHSQQTTINSHPSAWRTQSGTLLFATPKGLVLIDPAHFPINTLPPPVVTEQFEVDDRVQPTQVKPVILPPGPVHFTFHYAALSFTAPQKIHYRYMLQGFDRNWTDAGTRNTAYYTNIPPGQYTFLVQAANNDGIWNTTGSALPFTLRPHFYQTLWFRALLILLAIAAIFFLIRLRLRRANQEFNAVLNERNRIAREIHDTLAQGYAAVSMQLELLAELLRLRQTNAATTQLDQTRQTVRDNLLEARQSIWALRSHQADENTLPIRLQRLVESSSTDTLEIKLSTHGAYRTLTPSTEQEIFRIAQEALQNAKRHANASKIYIQLNYHADNLTLEVHDNGCGFDKTISTPQGHYGLTGMQERAASLHGKFHIHSTPGTGTTVHLSIAANQMR